MSDRTESTEKDYFEDQDIFECAVRAEMRATAALEDPEYTFISLEDESRIGPYLSSRPGRPSELTFANLYMWRKQYLYSTKMIDGTLLIRGEDDGRKFLFEPLGDGAGADLVHHLLKTERVASLERVSESFVSAHLDGDDRFEIRELRDHWDYIYERDDLAYLRGRRYHRKRNHVKRFIAAYDFEYIPVGSDQRESCRSIMREWCRSKDCENDDGLCAEMVASGELVDNTDLLDLVGGMILVEGKPAAFTLAEPVDDETVVIHVEKAIPNVVGLYQAINKFFCERSLEGYRYVNREQDLGIDGLRKAKESYFPTRMLRKFSVTLRS